MQCNFTTEWLIFCSIRITNSRCCPIVAGAPSVVTENTFFTSITLSSKCLVKVSSISFPVVVPCIGFKQHSSSCTSPSQQYLATTAKRGLSFISMLLSRATLKTFAVFNLYSLLLIYVFSYVCDASLYCPGRNRHILDSRNCAFVR